MIHNAKDICEKWQIHEKNHLRQEKSGFRAKNNTKWACYTTRYSLWFEKLGKNSVHPLLVCAFEQWAHLEL